MAQKRTALDPTPPNNRGANSKIIHPLSVAPPTHTGSLDRLTAARDRCLTARDATKDKHMWAFWQQRARYFERQLGVRNDLPTPEAQRS